MATETSSAVGSNGYARHFGGTVETVLASPRIAPPPATLEEARNQPGRREKIEELTRRIESEGIKYVFFQQVSITGRVMGKGVVATLLPAGRAEGLPARLRRDREPLHRPPRQLHRLRPRGVRARRDRRPRHVRRPAVGSARRARVLRLLRHGDRRPARRRPAPEPQEHRARVRAGARPAVPHRHRARDDVAARSPRTVEIPEGVTKPYCYHIHQFEELRPVLLDVVEYGQALGLDMSYGDHEDAPGQLELNFRFDRPRPHRGQHHDLPPGLRRGRPQARPARRASCRSRSPACRPTATTTTSRCRTRTARTSSTTPTAPPSSRELARHFLGGMLEHFPALMCVGNPTVNSYCRMWDTGFWAPIYKNWGWQNRTTTVRVASGGRFEYRGVDSSCNPYLTVATLLRAGLDGVRRKIDPGPPQQGNTYDLLSRGRRDREGPGQPRRGPRGAREGRGHQAARCRAASTGLQPLQARRVGALPRGGHRLGARRVPGGAALAMCGIAGIIYRDGDGGTTSAAT